ncbi:MAG TPA: MBL fold metallo-hydrolase [Candidatus Dormibacteraeota bacterium]|nr:MBL fold metallo-hydrolase [Candidatus Dormibacteraeota bacterium]
MSGFETFEDGDVRIVKVGPMGPYENNAYLVRDLARGESVLVDMPVEEGQLLEAIAADGGVRTIIVTHWHPDHWSSYDAVRTATSAPVLVGAKEIRIPAERIDGRLDHGATVPVGGQAIEVLHTPGHTPGSISLRIGRAVISGDTLFRGGPGKTSASGDLETLIRSIVDHLHPLDDETVVLPGHGASTTIGESRRQYAQYVNNPHDPGFYGDVEWIKGKG